MVISKRIVACPYLDRLGEVRNGVKDDISHFLISLNIEIIAKTLILKLSSLTICPRSAFQKCVPQRMDIKILVSADSLCRMSRPLNVLFQIVWLLADDDDVLPDVHLLESWLPDGDSRIFRSYVFGPTGFWTMAPLRCAAKFDPFLSLDCARVEGVGRQSKERTGSNFVA